MKTERRGLRGAVSAVLLAIAGILLAALCFRVALVEALPADAPSVVPFASHDPDVVLENAATALVRRRGILSPAMLDAVRRAAAAAPMDARPFLILGHQQLLDDRPRRAVATLEAGQRLDPRQRIIHMLLLDRYLRTGRYTDAAGQFSILARLVGSANGMIAGAMAQMSANPETHDAVRRTLRSDPGLENQVLIALARSKTTTPATIFALASPAALRSAGASEAWGPVLVSRLVDQGHFDQARSIWQRIYGLTDAQLATPLFDPGLHHLAGSAPFNWTLASGSVGAADIRDGALAIDYYGRDNGVLADQLLVLRPGAYRFGFVVEGSKGTGGPMLAWSLRCATPPRAELMNAVIATTGTRHREVADFTVPSGCPAQRLTLAGSAGEFSAPIEATIRDLDLHPAAGGRP